VAAVGDRFAQAIGNAAGDRHSAIHTFEQAQTELSARAEEKLREQAALLDVATDAIFVRDLENQIYLEGAEHLYGWKEDEAKGKNANELCTRNPAQLKEALQTVVLAGEWYGELHKVQNPAMKSLSKAAGH